MKILNLKIDALKPGMILYENLINHNGSIILNEDTIIDAFIIDKIKNHGIEKIRIKVSENEENDSERPVCIKSILNTGKVNDFRARYTEKVEEITYTIKKISNGEFVDVAQINKISKDIMIKFDTMGDVINYLSLARPLDDYTYAHSINVSLLSIIIARWLKIDEGYLDELATAGLLHDIGKTKIPDEIIAKPGKLTNEEFTIMKTHTIQGYGILKNMPNTTKMIMQGALLHHEKIDGTGYSVGLHDDDIPMVAKIIGLADIYDAMTSNRVYRNKLCPFEVIKNLETQTYGKIDTRVLMTFLNNIAGSYIGDFVELSNGEIAELMFINPNRVWQPIVKSGSQLIDLSKSNLEIECIV